MGFGAGLFLIALGAILTWAVKNPESGSVNVHVIGVILMIVGLVGFFLSLLFWESWAGSGLWRRRYMASGAVPAARPRGWAGYTRRATYVEQVPEAVPPPVAPPVAPPPAVPVAPPPDAPAPPY